MSYEIFMGDVKLCEDRLNGLIKTGLLDVTGLPVGGRTLNIDAISVLFSGSVGSSLTLDQVITQINSAYGSTIASKRNITNAPAVTSDNTGRMHAMALMILQKDEGFTILSTGTANPVFGFSATTPIVTDGKVAPNDVVAFTQGINQGHLVMIIDR